MENTQRNDGTAVFTREMRKTHKILIPNMLPMHFKMMIRIFKEYGYDCELLETTGFEIAACGLKYVHNDTCYPALLVIGQFIDALKSGKYDTRKVALLLTQTGGGCRASNYIYLLRKALVKAGFGYVPVISLNFLGMKDNPGFQMTLPMLHRTMYALFYGDLLMLLKNQCRPYEIEMGAAQSLAEQWTERLVAEMMEPGGLTGKNVRKNYKRILADFEALPRRKEEKVKVGIVGEIFVKFSPLGNNQLEDFLVSEGAEPRLPGMVDFCLYYVYNGIVDRELYGTSLLTATAYRIAYRFFLSKQKELIRIIKENSTFTPPTPFSHAIDLVRDYIGLGAKMGEGWLLPAEMLELIDAGVKNIVCTQPFGCLPNHVMGKGMMKPLKERNENVNIVAVDYDPGASRINQENRIKLMLENAKEQLQPKTDALSVTFAEEEELLTV